MAIPMTGKATVFDAITANTTTELHTLAGFGSNIAFGSTLLIEVVGAAATTWTLDFRGRITPDDTYTNIDFQQIWQAGAAALSNSQLSITDATRRYYVIRGMSQMLQFVSARTVGTGALTVRVSLTSEPFSQELLTTIRGSIFVEGATVHDAVDAGSSIKIGGVARSAPITNVAAGDRTDATFDVNGSQIVTIADDDVLSDAVTGTAATIQGWASNAIRALGVLPYALAPDASLDRLRSLGDIAGAGLGVLAAAPWIPGASDVKSIVVDVAAISATRQTLLTPTAGKKVRIISMEVVTRGLTTNPDRVGTYFGTGAAYTTTAANAIAEFVPGTTGEQSFQYPDGGGPVGAVDAVVSGITETETELTLRYTFQYREE